MQLVVERTVFLLQQIYLPLLLRQLGFVGAIVAGAVISLFCFGFLGLALQRFGIELW